MVTDLEDKRTGQLGSVFEGYGYVIAMLRVLDEDELPRRVTDESRSSWRDRQKAIAINRRLLARSPFPNEHFIDVTAEPAEQVADRIQGLT